MAIDYFDLRNWVIPKLEYRYTEKVNDSVCPRIRPGKNTIDTDELHFVHERRLETMPSMAFIFGHPGLWMSGPESGIDPSKAVRAETKMRLHQPLARSVVVIGRSRVTGVVDTGSNKDTLVVVECQLINKDSGATLATVEHISFCRAEGGFIIAGQPSDEWSARPAAPSRPADQSCDMSTRPAMALLHRLSSDTNPLMRIRKWQMWQVFPGRSCMACAPTVLRATPDIENVLRLSAGALAIVGRTHFLASISRGNDTHRDLARQRRRPQPGLFSVVRSEASQDLFKQRHRRYRRLNSVPVL
jgi:hypothetical protein